MNVIYYTCIPFTYYGDFNFGSNHRKFPFQDLNNFSQMLTATLGNNNICLQPATCVTIIAHVTANYLYLLSVIEIVERIFFSITLSYRCNVHLLVLIFLEIMLPNKSFGPHISL